MRKKNYRWYRHPKTTFERRANSDPTIRKYIRGKRLPSNLPDYHDDKPIRTNKSWKDRRLTQYRNKKRGCKHTIILNKHWHLGEIWKIKEYFQQHNIPYHTRKLYRIETKIITKQYEYKPLPGQGEWITFLRPVRQKGRKKHLTIYKLDRYWMCKWGWMWVNLPKARTVHRHYLIGYEITWWFDKNIGINYILRSSII